MLPTESFHFLEIVKDLVRFSNQKINCILSFNFQLICRMECAITFDNIPESVKVFIFPEAIFSMDGINLYQI